MVKQMLMYEVEIWGFETCNIIEIVQNQFCKIFLKLQVKTSQCVPEVNVADIYYLSTIIANVSNIGLD